MEMTMTCAEESRAAEETLAGTFKPADTFFLIESSLPEYGGWGGEAVKSAATSGSFAPYLDHVQSAPRAKVLFIRRPQSQEKNFYIAMTNQARPRIYHAALADYDDLLGLDISSLAAGMTPRINGREMTEIDELYTVCTNGRHDPCCAAHGTPVYHELAAQAGEERVWQTTHIGGHRMAATMIAFPQGIVYGHVDPQDAEMIVMNQRAGFMLTHKYRGRGAYAGHRLDTAAHQAAGAAEAVIRERIRAYRIDELRLDAVEELGGDVWRVRFKDSAGREHSADVSMNMSAPRQTSCGDAPKPMPQHDVALLAAT
ncbi:MAG: hypothetical protein OXG78_04685 [Chloroflexi bacterium]|nr:hypothetical protein [Chloroflexota bacterium]